MAAFMGIDALGKSIEDKANEINSRKERADKAKTRKRDIANTLIMNDTFREWAFEEMANAGFIGEGRELTSFNQGYRAGLVRLFMGLIEASDNGPDFMCDYMKYLTKGTKK